MLKRVVQQIQFEDFGGDESVPEDVDERYWAEAAQRNKIITSSTIPC